MNPMLKSLFAILAVFLPAVAFAQTGDVTAVHDPSIIQSGKSFYIFSTGRGLAMRSSPDLSHWKRLGRVFTTPPDWTRAYSPGGSMWAPDISFTEGEYRLYYAVSSFGQTASAVGLVVTKSLDKTSPDYRWIDRGKVIETPPQNNWNAIDPCVFDDQQGNDWMVLGSCWSGIKLVQLNQNTGLLATPRRPPISLAANPPENLIEEGYIRHRGGFYYLWVSDEHCCRGSDSTYCIKVGRSKTVTGPYIDRDGKPMLLGGGTLVLASYGNVRGPGSCAILPIGDRDFLIHHEYAADNNGTPTLQVRQLFWADDGWPVAGLPIVRSPGEKPSAFKPLAGNWSVRYDFANPRAISLHPDGTLTPTGTWHVAGNRLNLNWDKAARMVTEECTVAEDGSFFVGRDIQGRVITATR